MSVDTQLVRTTTSENCQTVVPRPDILRSTSSLDALEYPFFSLSEPWVFLRLSFVKRWSSEAPTLTTQCPKKKLHIPGRGEYQRRGIPRETPSLEIALSSLLLVCKQSAPQSTGESAQETVNRTLELLRPRSATCPNVSQPVLSPTCP